MAFFDQFQEVFLTLKSNKTRTILSGFSVSWGIFMLIVLLGSGNGLINGIRSNFRDRSNNVMNIYEGWTSMPYNGFAKDRRLPLMEDDRIYLLSMFSKNLIGITASQQVWGKTLSNGKDYVSAGVRGIEPLSFEMDGIKVAAGHGRILNEMDIKDHRKVAVIHPKTADLFYGGSEQAIGKDIQVSGVVFRVIGVYEAASQSDNQTIIIPLTTLIKVYSLPPTYRYLSLFVKDLDSREDNEKFMADIRLAMARKHQCDPQDKDAFWIWNRLDDYLQTMMIFNMITLAIWIIGIFTLISGIVGVSNIMLISVKERTKEFGIRKAIGAKPWSILQTVIVESLVITIIFGYIGMITGIGLTELVNMVMTQMQAGASSEMTTFKNPTVDIGIVAMATLVLVIAGTLAGFFPARKAVAIRPVEAFAAK